VLPRDEAVQHFLQMGEKYKAEIIASIPSNEPISSLGVLDNITDDGAALPSPVRRVPQGSFSSEPPLPKGSIVKENTPADRAFELDTQTKLTQLSDLLADDRLRAALEDMRRNG